MVRRPGSLVWVAMWMVLWMGGLSAFHPSSAWAKAREDTPEALFEKGERQMRRGYFDEAINTFDKVRNHFPLNPYSTRAELRVADCLFEKGEYLSAIDAYRSFERLHPQYPELDYVVFRVGQSQFRGSPRTIQRDQTATDLCVRALEGFEQRFPGSAYLKEVQKMKTIAIRRLAKRVESTAYYYYWRGFLSRGSARGTAMWAAARRYQQLIDQHPDYPDLDRAHYLLGMACLYLGDVDGARAAFAALQPPEGDHRPSRFLVRANRALAAPPKPVAPPEDRVVEIMPQGR